MVDKNKIRREIVVNSKPIFSKYGYQKANLDDISLTVGKKKSSLYYYFESKEEIFKALIDYESEVLLKNLTSEVNKYDSAVDQLRVYIFFRYQRLIEIVKEYNAIKNDFFNYIDLVYNVREKYDQLEITLLDEILERGVKDGYFFLENTALTAKAIHVSLKGIQLPFIIYPTPNDIEKRVEEIIKIIFYGIVKK